LTVGACSRNATPPLEKRHVFVIVMENKSVEQALQGPFTASLASKYRVATNYSAVAHPSLPNYLALTSGQTFGIRDDSYHVLPAGGIGSQLTAAGVTWRAYMEGMTDGGCLENTYPYDVHHNPFAYYGGRCPANVVPFTSLASDLKGNAPMFSWISPDLCHDQHDCGVSDGDDWLRQTVGMITQSKAWKANGLLFIVWDEDDGETENRVLSLVVSPQSRKVSNQAYTHYSLLATFEDTLGVGRLGQAAGAKTMTDLTGN
jgi:acid phosphatase